jgi:branched-subunit amino acid aminotransferase/4-amino-4-deoxychorismate lyase
LVLECAETCGLQLDPRPIVLHDATEGLWQEVFITSSSRLIYPISKILMHGENQKDFVEFWHDPALTGCTCPATKPKWRQLLDEILRRGGYPQK